MHEERPPTTEKMLLTPDKPSSDDVLVHVSGVSKKFCRSLKKSLWYGMKDIASEILPQSTDHLTQSNELRPDEFWAVNNVSFELRRGECLGLIGHNGAGKTTLLKMLNGLIKPDSGSITMRGRVGALIALGAGFNPVLTGRENIYVNGAVLGLKKKEVEEKIEDIIDFSEIREFIDAPVQSYSSGMAVRLGFAIATAIKPDILLLDEVLAVGDASFRTKCYNRISEIKDSAAIIFVSHHMPHVAQICSDVLHLHHGSRTFHGPVSDGIQSYLNCSSGTSRFSSVATNSPNIVSHDLKLSRQLFLKGDQMNANVQIVSTEKIDNVLLRLIVVDVDGNQIAEWNSDALQKKIDLESGKNELLIQLGKCSYRSGDYFLDLILYNSTRITNIALSRNRFSFKVNHNHIASHQLIIS